MDYTLHIILVLSLAVCACAYVPYGVVLQPRAGGGARAGAAAEDLLSSELLDEYEPYAYAAMPMPALQVLHVVSPPQPARRRRRPAPRPSPRPDPIYSEEQSYEHEGADDATVLVYARPNRHGGYTYRRPAPAYAPATAYTPTAAYASAHAPARPLVVRIHKYKLSTDR